VHTPDSTGVYGRVNGCLTCTVLILPIKIDKRLLYARDLFSKQRRLLNILFNIALVLFVLIRLRHMGFGQVWNAFPTEPMFYLVYIPQYAALPLSEMVIFRIAWPLANRVSLTALLRKRAMNAVVLGYSGDVWFFLWARSRLLIPAHQIALVLKDSAILSAIVSVVSTAALTVWLISLGAAGIFISAIGGQWRLISAVAVVCVLGLPVAFRLRHRIFLLPPSKLFAILNLHTVRLITTQAFQVLQWAIVLPTVPFQSWLMFLTVQMLIQQMPFVPNRDILFLAIGVQLTHSAGVDHTALVSMFLAMTAVKQLSNYVTLAATAIIGHSSAGRAAM